MTTKRASGAGQDLRSPVSGGTKFPTDDSKAFANSLLRQGQRSAETMSRPSGPSIHAIASHSSSAKAGSLPKLGSVADDPLIQYLRKHAQDKYEEVGPVVDSDGRTCGKDWPKGERAYTTGELDQNRDAMPKGKEEFELTSQPPIPTDRMTEIGIEPWRVLLREMFDTKTPPRDKLYHKDHPSTVGEVDTLLRKFE